MAGTRRTPISRQYTPSITETAIKVFMEMQRCYCTCPPRDPDNPGARKDCSGCAKWWALHSDLCHELGKRPWQWPCIEDPRAGNPEPLGTLNHAEWRPDEEARARWRALEAGARELRRQQRQAKRNAQPDATPPPS
jgi:hypothetical protein